MAEKKVDTAELYDKLILSMEAGNYSPVYVLMGGEGYYIDKVCDYITDHALTLT